VAFLIPDRTARSWRRTGLVWLGLSLLVLGLDQATKHWASQVLVYGVPQPVLPGLNWTLAHNPGAAFSLFADQSGWQRWFLLVIKVVVSVLILLWLARTDRREWWICAPLAAIVGGALGNAIDRALYGYVIDFIQVYYQRWAWPTFNVADSAIVCGAIALVLFEARQWRRAEERR
jgi:signal peptidase II